MAARFVLLAALAAFAAGAQAEVHKCVDAAGQVSFQDTECAAGSSDTVVHMAAPPPMSAAAPTSEGGEEAAPGPAPVAARVRPPPIGASSGPTLWQCTRPEDGSQYMSKDGITTPRMVPAGVLGMPNKSLNEAYSGPNGVGVSAPGVRPIPVDRSPAASAASGYVAVQDRCEPASKQDACEYLQKEYDRIHTKLRRAFKDEQAVLEPQQAEIEAQLNSCD